MIRSRSIFDAVHQVRYFCDAPKKITWQVLSDQNSIKNLDHIPLELQYAIAIHPSRLRFVKNLIDRGHGLALGRYCKADCEIIKAVKVIAETHHGALYPWLEDLVVKNVAPVFSESDSEEASLQGIDLMEQVAIIKNHASQLIQIKIVESGGSIVGLEDKKTVAAMARDIQKIHSLQAVEYLYSQSIHQKKHTLLLLIFGLLIFAPVAHFLESIFAGLGKFAALLLPNIFLQFMFVVSAYNHGTAVWQIKTRLKKQWPEIIILITGAVLVQFFISLGSLLSAGIIFSLSAPVLIIGQSLRKLFRSKKIFALLASEGKIAKNTAVYWARIFYGPYWIVYPLGLILAVVVTVLTFHYFPQYLHNGWFLLILAVLYYPFSGAFFAFWSKTTAFRFKSRLRSLLRKAIIS